MIYIGAYLEGADGRSYGRRHPKLKIHFFEPSLTFFNKLIAHRNSTNESVSYGNEDVFGNDADGDVESENFFFHNYGVGPKNTV